MRESENKCSSTIPVSAFRNHVFESKEIFQCWIRVMIVYYTYLIMCVPDESLLSPQFASSRIEGSLWHLKQRGEGESFMANA